MHNEALSVSENFVSALRGRNIYMTAPTRIQKWAEVIFQRTFQAANTLSEPSTSLIPHFNNWKISSIQQYIRHLAKMKGKTVQTNTGRAIYFYSWKLLQVSQKWNRESTKFWKMKSLIGQRDDASQRQALRLHAASSNQRLVEAFEPNCALLTIFKKWY